MLRPLILFRCSCIISLAEYPLKVNSGYSAMIHYCQKGGQRIRNLREDKDLTQREMGEILSCSQRVYSNYERGELDIPTEILIKLAKFHNTTTDYILGLTNKK